MRLFPLLAVRSLARGSDASSSCTGARETTPSIASTSSADVWRSLPGRLGEPTSGDWPSGGGLTLAEERERELDVDDEGSWCIMRDEARPPIDGDAVMLRLRVLRLYDGVA